VSTALRLLVTASEAGAPFAMYRLAQLLHEAEERAPTDTVSDASTPRPAEPPLPSPQHLRRTADAALAAAVAQARSHGHLHGSAQHWFERAATAGHAAAAFWAGYLLHQRVDEAHHAEDGETKADLERAHAYLKLAHERGYKAATHYLSRFYRDPTLPYCNVHVLLRGFFRSMVYSKVGD